MKFTFWHYLTTAIQEQCVQCEIVRNSSSKTKTFTIIFISAFQSPVTNRKIIHINKKTEFIICKHHESIKASIPFHLVNGFLLNTWGKPSLNWNNKFLFNGSLNSPLLAFLHDNYGCQSCPAQRQLRFLDVIFYSWALKF